MSCDCANRIDQWQQEGFLQRYETVKSEFHLLKSIGYNSIRIIIDFWVWLDEHDSFMENLEKYISAAHEYGISCMVTLANDCCVPKKYFKRPQMGEQYYDWGYHGGRKKSQHDGMDEMGFNFLDDPQHREKFYIMFREIMGKYKDDARIIVWDLYNEPGNNHRETQSISLLKEMFQIAWGISPSQPCTAGVWKKIRTENELMEIEKLAITLSDVISFHSYESYEENVIILKHLKKYNRPIFCTEWLHRPFKNNVAEIFPLFYLERIACYNWGFVAGKYQTYEPWGGMWKQYDEGVGNDIDFTKWQHDLFRPSHRPYDPKEIELLTKFCKLADEDGALKNMKKSKGQK